ncbi:MAG TPA: leucyl/phenylalanyl-tRNA--protein transferase [Chitinophagaceae bacterium]|nr:leucyl/phenylalanyl-tRNA--protein transferase [Chitinophagaceae bacterium]
MFPDLSTAREDGLLAIGGELTVDTLRHAYHSGIFPWFSGKIPMWYSPDPRFVLFPENLVVSKSMKQVIKSNKFSFTVDKAFKDVIINCSTVEREGQWGTWITDDMINAYVALHKEGMAHSAEAWMDGKLVGGLYGVKVGHVFCGESMFSHVSNASKFAFIKYVQDVLIPEGVELIDCQVHTPHLESLGAEMIPRDEFVKYLK